MYVYSLTKNIDWIKESQTMKKKYIVGFYNNGIFLLSLFCYAKKASIARNKSIMN